MTNIIKISKFILIFLLKCCFFTMFIFFLIQRNLLFETLKPEYIPVETNYDGIDIFLVDKKSDTDIVFCHGSIISGKIYKLLLNTMATKTGYNVISFNLRGMFNNRGVPSEKGMREEVDTFIKHYVKNRNKKLIAFGQSLGCGLAIQIGEKLRLEKVILENPLLDYKSLIKAKLKYPLITNLIVDNWDNRVINKLDNVLFLLSEQDGLIPNDDGIALSKMVKTETVKFLKESTHYNANRNPEYYKSICKYLNDELIL